VTKLLWIAGGGAIGAVARYLVGGLAMRLLGAGFPWGTLCVNATGSLLIGFLAAALEDLPVSQGVRLCVLTGLLGAFTTFSTFSFETVEMLRERQWLLAGVNVIGSCVLGIAMVITGLFAARWALGAWR
jgi:fluoride exporter